LRLPSRDSAGHPARLVPQAFLLTVIVGTGLSLLPVARVDKGGVLL
jgi:hypothetical protein